MAGPQADVTRVDNAQEGVRDAAIAAWYSINGISKVILCVKDDF